jgi:hypothetical protein
MPSTSPPQTWSSTGSCPISPCQRCSGTLWCRISMSPGALAARHGQRRPGPPRQQHHPRAARRAGWRLGKRARPPRRPRLPPAELHDLALMVFFGIVLNRNGRRIDYLAMNTPVEELTLTADAAHPDLVLPAATHPEHLEPLAPQLTASPGASRSPRQEPAPRPRSREPSGPAANRRPGHRGRECQMAAVDAPSRTASLASRAAGCARHRPRSPRCGRDDAPPRPAHDGAGTPIYGEVHESARRASSPASGRRRCRPSVLRGPGRHPARSSASAAKRPIMPRSLSGLASSAVTAPAVQAGVSVLAQRRRDDGRGRSRPRTADRSRKPLPRVNHRP